MRSKGPAPLLFLKADYRNVSFIQNAGGKMGIFEIYKDRIGEYRWRLLANNNQVIATSEGYASKAGCKNGIDSGKKNAPKAKIDGQTK